MRPHMKSFISAFRYSYSSLEEAQVTPFRENLGGKPRSISVDIFRVIFIIVTNK